MEFPCTTTSIEEAQEDTSPKTPPFPPSSPSSSHHWAPSFPNPGSENMFEKVVTPSDVGKLNRLVIPKQHAERCFPLDPASNSNGGLILNFEEEGTGRSWRFRYSYWNSSQSYVMTKGWSRFVKDKSLNPGDVGSFSRGPGGRLFIGWRRRPVSPVIPAWGQGSLMPTSLYHGAQKPLLQNREVMVQEDNGILHSLPMTHWSSIRPGQHVRLFGVNLGRPEEEEPPPPPSLSARFRSSS